MNNRQAFETLVLPHLDAAYNLARWLLRNDQAAEDAVQDASLRAYRYIDSLHGQDARPWLLGIVRNTCFTVLERARNGPRQVELDEAELDSAQGEVERSNFDPAAQLQRQHERQQIDAALRSLSAPLREVIVLREFEDLDYAQIAKIVAVPIGTVMSRLARARDKLRNILTKENLGE